MTFAPKSIKDVMDYWVAHGGVNSGIVGNLVHCNGYHLGKDRIFGACACKPSGKCVPGRRGDDYSVQTARDKAGLSNAASAMDLGRLEKSLPKLWKFSVWLVKQIRADAPGTRDIKEVIFSPDGKNVYGFNRERGLQVRPSSGITGTAPTGGTPTSASTVTAKTEARSRLFAPYFEGEGVNSFDTPAVPSVAMVAKGAKLYETSNLTGHGDHGRPGAGDALLRTARQGGRHDPADQRDGRAHGQVSCSPGSPISVVSDRRRSPAMQRPSARPTSRLRVRTARQPGSPSASRTSRSAWPASLA